MTVPIFRIVVPAGAALLALVVAELGLRVVRPVPFAPEHNMVFEADPDTGYRIKPGGRGRHANGADMAASSQGLRNREVGRKGEHDFRILVLGDSFTAGSSVERDQAYPQVLETLLARRATRPVEVVNAGVGGWDPFQYAQYFAREGFRFEPDLVVVGFFVGNDTYSTALSVDSLPTALGGRRLSRAAAARWTIRWEVLLYEHSHLVRALRPTLSDYRPRRSCDDFSASLLAIQAVRLANHLRPTPELVASAQANVDQILRLRDRAAERNVPVVVALLPDENQVNAALQARLLTGKSASLYDFSMPQALLRDRFEEARVPVIDLLPAFRSDPQCLYNNTTHWTAQGHALAAEGIAGGLEEMGTVPTSSAGAEATLRGRVVTEHDDPVVGAAVTFISPGAFPQTVGTDRTGTFRIACIPPGENYEIRIDEPGYRPFRRESIRAKAPVTELRITLRGAT